jgi:hypothetical protein
MSPTKVLLEVAMTVDKSESKDKYYTQVNQSIDQRLSELAKSVDRFSRGLDQGQLKPPSIMGR